MSRTLTSDEVHVDELRLLDHPALNLAIAEVDASSDLESIRRRLFSLNKQSREEALFIYCFLGDEPVME